MRSHLRASFLSRLRVDLQKPVASKENREREREKEKEREREREKLEKSFALGTF